MLQWKKLTPLVKWRQDMNHSDGRYWCWWSRDDSLRCIQHISDGKTTHCGYWYYENYFLLSYSWRQLSLAVIVLSKTVKAVRWTINMENSLSSHYEVIYQECDRLLQKANFVIQGGISFNDWECSIISHSAVICSQPTDSKTVRIL